MNHGVSNMGNPKLFHQAKSSEKNIKKRCTKSIDKSYLIDPLTTNNAICHDSLTWNMAYKHC